jgi:alcohol dehydrogenase (cytochrome c)
MDSIEGDRAKSIGRDQRLALIVAGVAILLAIAGAIVLSGSSSGPDAAGHTDTAYPHVDLTNSRAVGGPIQAATVSGLEIAWTLSLAPESTFNRYQSTPTIANGVAFWQDSVSSVQAIDLKSGKVLWEKQYDSPVSGPNGVVAAGGRVYGATTTDAFALEQKTGDELWSIPLADGKSEEIHMAPGHHKGIVYVSTAPAAFEGGEVGVLWALNSQTGAKIWSFHTAPKNLWGNPQLNFGGGLYEPPAFDEEGSMYFGVGGAGPTAGTKQEPWGESRPGPNLYTASLVKLDSRTGKLKWYYQVTPHAVCNWSLQGSPILVDTGKRKLAIASGKAGIVVAVDQATGKLAWKRQVGLHNGHDDDGLQAMRGDYSNLKLPMTVYPGGLGGVASASSTDGSTIFVPIMNYASELLTQERGEFARVRTGEVVALGVETGEIRWKRKFPEAVYGPTSVVNDLVLASTLSGDAYALDAKTGDVKWKVSLPAGMSSGFGVSGDTVLAPAGIEVGETGETQMVAYRLGG